MGLTSTALPLRIPWVTRAYTFVAPDSSRLLAASPIVPHVSAMSSTRIATLPVTDPTRIIRDWTRTCTKNQWSVWALDLRQAEDDRD